MDPLILRTVHTEDILHCHAIEQLVFRSSEAATLERMEKRARLFPQGFLVAERNRQIVGYINSGATNSDDLADESLKDLANHDPDAPNLVVFSVAVCPDCQGQGIAARLLQDFVERGKTLGKKAVLLICQPELVPYYARFGFRHIGESASTHGDSRWHEMRLDLPV